jgi:hypothetical protein
MYNQNHCEHREAMRGNLKVFSPTFYVGFSFIAVLPQVA